MQGGLNAPALQGCRITAFQLTSATVVGGGLIQAVIQVSPPCQQAINQGLLRIRVTGSLPGISEGEVNPRPGVPGSYSVAIGTPRVTQPTDVTLMALLSLRGSITPETGCS